ncbi:Hsp70 family protein [Actinoplanes sp. URMC 104]|uniref:Hsp70 family protein n=1 Tax=Actinoplanes sp. URMC 104 TaxID=3423409 RepID=UPI003F1C7639
MTIDYGSVATRAVLTWRGSRTPLIFDGQVELSSAVHVSDGQLVIGARAWQLAESDPDGFVPSPLHAGTGQLDVRGTAWEVADLVAATLSHVHAEAVRAAGTPVREVRLVVPAGWGPRRRTWMRHACRSAGLPVTRMLDTPIAVAQAAMPAGASPLGTTALVIDMGSGCEVTVVAHGPAGWEVLSTLTDPDAGGNRIDAALTAALAGDQLEQLTAGGRWTLVAAIRTAKQALTGQAAVTVPLLPGEPAVVVTAALLQQVSQPIADRAAALAATAVANADLTLDQIGAVHLIGAAAATPGAGTMIAAKLSRPVQVGPCPGIAAAVSAGAPPAPAGPDHELVALPPLRRLLGMALPGLAALVLYAHFLLSADFNNGTPQRSRPGYYVLASWGELTTACVLISVTALQAAGLLAALLAQRNPETDPTGAAPSRIAGGLLASAGLSAALAGLFAVTAAEFFALPVSALMRWALLPLLPLLGVAVVLAAVSHKTSHPPAGGWDRLLTFPASSVITATAGIVAVALWWQGSLPAALNGWGGTIGTAGGLLTGIAIACTLVRNPAGRTILAVFTALFTLVLSRSGPETIAVIYALSVAALYGMRTWAATNRHARPFAPHFQSQELPSQSGLG